MQRPLSPQERTNYMFEALTTLMMIQRIMTLRAQLDFLESDGAEDFYETTHLGMMERATNTELTRRMAEVKRCLGLGPAASIQNSLTMQGITQYLRSLHPMMNVNFLDPADFRPGDTVNIDTEVENFRQQYFPHAATLSSLEEDKPSATVVQHLIARVVLNIGAPETARQRFYMVSTAANPGGSLSLMTASTVRGVSFLSNPGRTYQGNAENLNRTNNQQPSRPNW